MRANADRIRTCLLLISWCSFTIYGSVKAQDTDGRSGASVAAPTDDAQTSADYDATPPGSSRLFGGFDIVHHQPTATSSSPLAGTEHSNFNSAVNSSAVTSSTRTSTTTLSVPSTAPVGGSGTISSTVLGTRAASGSVATSTADSLTVAESVRSTDVGRFGAAKPTTSVTAAAVLFSTDDGTIAASSSSPPTSTARFPSPTFTVRPHPNYPWAILQLHYQPPHAAEAGYAAYRVNYTDVSFGPNGGAQGGGAALPPASYVLHRDENPFNIYGLNPGHKYRIVVIASRETDHRGGDVRRAGGEQTVVFTQVAATRPKAPDFNDTDIHVDTTSLTLKGQKSSGALQDSFSISYDQLLPFAANPRLRVNDLPERTLELYLPNLNAGRSYNVSVYAVKDGDTSKPWTKIITTRPNPPVTPEISATDTGALVVRWGAPLASGVDSYMVSYRPLTATSADAQDATRNMTVLSTSARLTDQLYPGKRYLVFIYAQMADEISDPVHLNFTVKPLPPHSYRITADYTKAAFRLRFLLPGNTTSHVDLCQLQISPQAVLVGAGGEGDRRRNITTNVKAFDKLSSCDFLVSLRPGQRYEFQAWAISGNTYSHPLTNSTAIRPAFSVDSFGLQTAFPQENWLELTWPADPHRRAEVDRVWGSIVGNDSRLDVTLQGDDSALKRHKSANPLLGETVIFERLNQGACYTMHLYTLTSSGIMSENTHRLAVRTPPPPGYTSLEYAGQTSARLAVSVDSVSSAKGLANCQLILTTTTAAAPRQAVNNRSIPLDAQTKHRVDIGNLRPYTEYVTAAMVRCSDAVAPSDERQCGAKERPVSPLRFRTDQGVPGPVRNVSVKMESPFSCLISWLRPLDENGLISSYVVHVMPAGGNAAAPWNVTVPAHNVGVQERARIEGLLGGAAYAFDVRARTVAGLGAGLDDDHHAAAVPAVTPSPFTAGSRLARVTMPVWSPPKPRAPPLPLPKSVGANYFSVRFSTADFSARHGPLTKYAVVVVEHTEGGSDDGDTLLTWRDVSRLGADVAWPAYVAMERPLAATSANVGGDTVTEAVGVDDTCTTEDDDDGVTANAETTHEDRTLTRTQSSQHGGLCNGPLRAQRSYRVKLRLYTADDKFADSDPSDVVVTDAEPSAAGRTILVVIFGVFLALCLAFAALLLAHRARLCQGGRGRTKHRHRPTTDSDSSTGGSAQGWKRQPAQWLRTMMAALAPPAQDCLGKLGMDAAAPGQTAARGHTANGLMPNPFGAHRRSRSLRERTGFDAKLDRTPTHSLGSRPPMPILPTVVTGADSDRSRPVKQVDFAEHVRLMSADTDFRFSEEYEDLKLVGRGEPCTASELAVNRSKNRFTNILPYDHSRVKLAPVDDEDGSDFINASYIPGENSRREFIAAQGPLPSTRDDFWRMVWECQCPAVLNLTRCVEKGRDKCHQYWPDTTEPVTYGDIEVTMMNELKMQDLIVREFRLTDMVEEGREPPRTLRHFHYVGWPDFGVPDRPHAIVQLVRAFRQRVPPSPHCHPTVVHCSAGVGRSGTLIALDRVLQVMRTRPHDPIDVFGIVHEMRKERVLMVQTEQQYIFIHHCLLCALEGRENDDYSKPAYPVAVATPVIALQSPSPPPGALLPPAGAGAPRSAPPCVQVHQNPAFEDDEGIAESGF